MGPPRGPASALGALASIVTLGFLGRWLNNRPERVLIDVESGERLVYKPRHSLFWIPLQYWTGASSGSWAGWRSCSCKGGEMGVLISSECRQ